MTGGSRGLGRAMAVALAGQGHRVAVTGRDDQLLKEVVKELPGGVALHADVSDPGHTHSVIDEVTQDIGPIDVLTLCADSGQQVSEGDASPRDLVRKALATMGQDSLITFNPGGWQA